MNSDQNLEELIRSTFAEQANQIDTGPRWAGSSTPHPHSRRWPAIAAAASVVLLVGAATAWRASTSDSDVAGGRYHAACTSTLPTAWRTALDARPITVDGDTPPVAGVLGDGSAVTEPVGGPYGNQVALVTRAGQVTSLYTLPTGAFGLTTDVSSRWVVLSISASRDGQGSISGTTNIVAIDSRDRHVLHLLRGAPAALRPRTTPPGRSVPDAIGSAVIQGNTVYWTVATGHARAGLVVGYNLATHRYRKVGNYHGAAFVTRDARGVFWHGGVVAAPHLPASVAALLKRTTVRSLTVQSVDSDGTHFAWAGTHSPVVHWAGPNDNANYAVRQIDGDDDPAFQPIVAVSGPIVLMFTSEQSATYHLLDTRTGALADTGIGPGGSAYAIGSTLYLTRPIPSVGHHNETGTVAIDTAKLPTLHC